MKTLRPIFKCHGGKFYLHQWIISHFPKNYTQLKYIEGCGGAASVLLNKERSVVEIYNDADPSITAIVKELAAENPLEFINSVKRVEYNKETFEQSKTATDTLSELIRRRFSRGGLREAFSWSDRLRGGRPGDVNAWETFKLELVHIAERLSEVQVCCMPIGELVERFDAEDVLWYIDPPYLPRTRQSHQVYAVEMGEKDHVELANKLKEAKGKVVLSGYPSSLYTKLYKGWNLTCRPIANHSGQRKNKQRRIECLWRNYK
jgi:DNA adenine methylase